MTLFKNKFKKGSIGSYAVIAVTGIVIGGVTLWSLRELWTIGAPGQRPFAAVQYSNYAAQPQYPQYSAQPQYSLSSPPGFSTSASTPYPYDGTPGPFVANLF